MAKGAYLFLASFVLSFGLARHRRADLGAAARRRGDRINDCRFAAVHESVYGVRREKAALSSGCKSHPATAPAGSNRSSHGGNEVAEAFG